MTILPVGSCNATYSLFNFETPYTLFLTCHKNRYNTHLSPRLLHRSFVLEFFVFSVENHFRRFLIPISDHRKPNLSHPLPVSPLFCSSNCFPPKFLRVKLFVYLFKISKLFHFHKYFDPVHISCSPREIKWKTPFSISVLYHWRWTRWSENHSLPPTTSLDA